MVTLAIASLTRNNRFVPALRALVRKIATSLNATLDGIEEARTLASRYETLSRLSDAELARRGIARSDIPRVVLAGTRGR